MAVALALEQGTLRLLEFRGARGTTTGPLIQRSSLLAADGSPSFALRSLAVLVESYYRKPLAFVPASQPACFSAPLPAT